MHYKPFETLALSVENLSGSYQISQNISKQSWQFITILGFGKAQIAGTI